MIRNRCERCNDKMPWWYRFMIFLYCPLCIERIFAPKGQASE